MAPIILVLALIIQCSFAHPDSEVLEEKVPPTNDVVQENLNNDAVKDFSTSYKQWHDIFTVPDSNMFPGSSAAMMSQITNSNRTAEEVIQDMKAMAKEISSVLEDEVMNLLALAMTNVEQEVDENGIRKKRSVETPMDSSQMVMKLLKHIKSNNEYQNVAIEKMMTAQEIAQKFGIEFNPDPEILSDLAIAAHDHALEMTNMLRDACEMKNVTSEKTLFIPLDDEPQKQNETYYVYGMHYEDEDLPSFEYTPEIPSKIPEHNHYYAYESQISSPPVHHHSTPVTHKPSFYDQLIYPFTPVSDFYSPYSVETIMPGLLIPIEELEPEPELVGEEVEETITSRMLVEKGDEPGSTTVNHVTTYTLSEKSHFRPPHIDRLPQQLQYCLFMI